MKLIVWSYAQLELPMVQLADGKLYCTASVLCNALRIKPSSLRSICHDHANELSDLSVAESNAKEFLDAHRQDLGIVRVKDDMRLFSDRDMLTIAMVAKSAVSASMRTAIVDLIITNAKVGMVEPTTHERVLAQLEAQNERIARLEEIVGIATSAAGKSLRAARDN